MSCFKTYRIPPGLDGTGSGYSCQRSNHAAWIEEEYAVQHSSTTCSCCTRSVLARLVPGKNTCAMDRESCKAIYCNHSHLAPRGFQGPCQSATGYSFSFSSWSEESVSWAWASLLRFLRQDWNVTLAKFGVSLSFLCMENKFGLCDHHLTDWRRTSWSSNVSPLEAGPFFVHTCTDAEVKCDRQYPPRLQVR